MHDMLAEAAGATAAESAGAGRMSRLSRTRPGDRGTITEVSVTGEHGVTMAELERRLLEFGFVEGARIELLHEGAIGHDPIAVRVDGMRVALRRRDAEDVWVMLDSNPE